MPRPIVSGRYPISNTPMGLSLAPTFWARGDSAHVINGTVDAWCDMSGGGRHPIQATVANQPVVVDQGIYGRPTVKFDGSNDFLTTTYTLAQPYTRVLVYKMNTLTGPSGHDVIADGGVLGTSAFSADSTPRDVMLIGSLLVAPGSFGNAVFVYAFAEWNNTASALWINGTFQIRGTVGGANAAGGITLGALQNGTRSAAVEIAEAIDYPGILTDADRTQLSGYFNMFYGL